MSVQGQQDFWVTGARLYFIKTGSTYGSLIDMGLVRSVTPAITADKVQIFDADGGLQKLADETTIKIDESYDVTVGSMNLDNIATLLLGSEPEAFTQATTPVTRTYLADIGTNRYIKLLDSSGTFMFNFASAVVQNSGLSITYVENTDWKWLSKERGIIKIISGGAIAQGQTVSITAIPNALSGKRLVRAQKVSTIKGQFLLVFSRDNNASQTARYFNGSISPNGENLPADNYADMTFKAAVLSDATDLVQPAGSVLQFAGSLPSL